MNNELITIIVPVYNVEKYLDRCINSIVNQTYTNLEIILVDDGSPDNCPAKCDEWAKKDTRIKVIHKENAGAGLARNTGLDYSTGKYICFFDSDDYVDHTLVEKAVDIIQRENAQIVIFGSNQTFISDNSTIFIPRIPQTENNTFSGRYLTEVFLPDLIDPNRKNAVNKNLTFSLWSCLFDSRLFTNNNNRFQSERDIFSEDSLMLLDIYKSIEKVAVLPEALYYYCENESSISHTVNIRKFDTLVLFYDRCLKVIKDNFYPCHTQSRIDGLVMSFVIGFLKNISNTNMSVKSQLQQFEYIVKSDIVCSILKNPNIYKTSWKRKCLFITLRCKFYYFTYLLVKIKRKGRK